MKPGINIPIYYEKYSRDVSVGRVKIEKRNFCRVQCVEENISATLQLADSVFLYDEEKGPISIFELKPGCKIRFVSDSPGRHLGNKIEEDIIEL
jgi:3-dehydroquinate synthase II